MIVIDTLMAATSISETNDNGQAVKMMNHLRAITEQHDCAILILHHERKQSREHPNSSGQAAMGARQWIGQADAQMTLTVASPMDVQDFGAADAPGRIAPEATRRLSKTFKWLPAEKDREGEPNRAQIVSVTSEKGEDRRLLWMIVENEGELLSTHEETGDEMLAISIGALVQSWGSQGKRADIAKSLGRDAKDKDFRRALEHALEAGYIVKGKKQGDYAPGSVKVLDVS